MDDKPIMKITTESGAIYYLYAQSKITGGSKNLKNGTLLNAAILGRSLLISTPERQAQNPTAVMPGVTSSRVVNIETIP